MRMQIMVPSSFSAIIFIAYFMGAIEKVDSSRLEGKIFHGRLAEKNKYKYMASLQVNGHHVCSSALFKQGFLLSAGECIRYIARCIQKEQHKHTAVLGDIYLRAGQRINVLKLAHFDNDNWFGDDIGLVMLANNVDYSRVQVIHLFHDKINLITHGKDALVCGWGSVKKDDEKYGSIGNAEYSENLHCLPLSFSNRQDCYRHVGIGDYANQLSCAKAKFAGKKITLGDTGSPVTKAIKENGNLTHYIVGITLSATTGKRDSYLRIMRSSAILKDIEEMEKVLQSHQVVKMECCSSSEEDITDNLNKHRKI